MRHALCSMPHGLTPFEQFERIRHSRMIEPVRLARPPHSAWLEGGPEGEADGGQAL